jgi:hypothetical protein
MKGEYRKHAVEVSLMSNGDGRYTTLKVHLSNPRGIAMRLHKKRRLNLIEKALGDKDISLNDPEFDRKYELYANSSEWIRLIINEGLRRRIVDATDFSLFIEEDKPDEAHTMLGNYVKDDGALRSILD